MKRTSIQFLSLGLAILMLLSLAACSAAPDKEAMNMGTWYQNNNISPEVGQVPNPDEPTFLENPFVSTAVENQSTFSVDVDTASYSYFRKLVNANYQLATLQQNAAGFRTEEFVNYFKYNSVDPTGDDLFGVTSSISVCPWNEANHLLTLTLQTSRLDTGTRPPNNLVFLIDVSGSMSSADKLPLIKKAFATLVSSLTPQDKVSIVTYSGKEAVVLSGANGSQGEEIMSAIHSLVASGSTNGQAGLEMAYRVAESHMVEGGNNRIIMASDGDLNVGISSEEELKSFIEGKRNQGVYLSVLGFGTGNYQDSKMETIARYGSGVYYYIDGEGEAEKVFGTDLLSTMYTVADDVRLQLTFDKELISAYRLIGYENRVMDNQDFTDNKKDSAEVGMFHQITACYELKLTESAAAQPSETPLMTLSVGYKKPGESISLYNSHTIAWTSAAAHSQEDVAFISCVIETCMLLHRSQHWDSANNTVEKLANLITRLERLDLSGQPEREEFLHLLKDLYYNSTHGR